MVPATSRLQSAPRTVQKFALLMLLAVTASQAALSQAVRAVSGFAPQMRLGYRNGDQWEPAMAADAHGHIYVLYPQYGAVPDCPACTAPTIALLVSSDNGLSWHSSRPLLPFPTGQFDPQIVVDPQDRQTVYASWLQNEKRDIIVARSLDFGRTWSFSVAEHSREDADKPVLAVHGADVYVGFNHEEKFLVAASHDAGQTFSVVSVNPAAPPGWSLAGGATVDPAGNVYFGWTACQSKKAGASTRHQAISGRQHVPTNEQSRSRKIRIRSHAHMRGKKSLKHLGLLRKYSHRLPPQSRTPPEPKHQLRHDRRPPQNSPMRLLITRKITTCQRISQRRRLPERQTQPFARNRIHAPRRIADQRHVPAPNARQPPRRSK